MHGERCLYELLLLAQNRPGRASVRVHHTKQNQVGIESVDDDMLTGKCLLATSTNPFHEFLLALPRLIRRAHDPSPRLCKILQGELEPVHESRARRDTIRIPHLVFYRPCTQLELLSGQPDTLEPTEPLLPNLGHRHNSVHGQNDLLRLTRNCPQMDYIGANLLYESRLPDFPSFMCVRRQLRRFRTTINETIEVDEQSVPLRLLAHILQEVRITL